MVRDGDDFAGDRLDPNLVTAGGLARERKPKGSQAPHYLSIPEASQPPHV